MDRILSVAAGLVLMLIGIQVIATGAPGNAREVPEELLRPLLSHYQQDKHALGNSRFIALLNYRQPSWEPRFYIIDPEKLEIVAAYRVAHGKGSDPDHTGFAEVFGDGEGSHMSSVGLFRTGDVYMSEQDGHGMSLRLEGLSATNASAMDRNIVIHANHYLEREFLNTYGMPGRSHGCLVFSEADRDDVIARLRGGALIYAVH